MSSESLSSKGITSIFHPSDFTEASEAAFAHALRIALASRCGLTLFHAAMDGSLPWDEFPGVRRTLEKWKVLPPGSRRRAVAALGIDLRKIVSRGSEPVETVLNFLEGHPADLIVLATRSHQGRMHWLRTSVAEPIARESHQMTLFVPHEVQGFVSREDGSVHLRNVLIPVAHDPWPQPAITAVTRLAAGLDLRDVTFHLLHVGEPGALPALELPQSPGWLWKKVYRSGSVLDAILAAADEFDADLAVMTTDGHHGFLDGLRGNTTEQVVHRARCPLLAVPAMAPG